MTTFGIVVAIVLLLWVSLLYVPFRWRPVGIYLFIPKVFAVGYVPFMTALGIVLAGTGALVGAWWIVGLAASRPRVADPRKFQSTSPPGRPAATGRSDSRRSCYSIRRPRLD